MPSGPLPPNDRYAAWADGISPAEQRARLRALRVLTYLYCGPRGRWVCARLAEAEHDPDALIPAHAALNSLSPVDLRRVLGSYAATHRPPALTPSRKPNNARREHDRNRVVP